MVKGVFVCAALIVVVFLVCHAAGLRESTSVLSGTYTGAGSVTSGLAYAVVNMALVILTPILVIAAGMLFLLNLAFVTLDRRQDQS
jgi:hypothetical protein